MGYPTEDGSEHERLRAYPRVVIRMTNMELIIWRSCICRYLLFLMGYFWSFFDKCVNLAWG